MNTKFFWTIALFILIYINPVHAQNNTAKAVQIQLEGIGLDSFTIEVKGNEILINGKSPDSSGMKLLFVKTDTHTGNKMISEHGIEYRPEVKASVLIGITADYAHLLCPGYRRPVPAVYIHISE